jgi:glutathione S-transferase
LGVDISLVIAVRQSVSSAKSPPTEKIREETSMLTLHHLNDSRSQRILWLLEELGVPYEMKRYQRDARTRLAPPELEAVHPLGKSPVITDGDIRIAESGAIVDYMIRRYGKGGMMPAPDSVEYISYNEWLHYSEGSAMLPLMLNLYVSRLKEAAAPLQPRIDSEIANHLGYVDGALKGREFFIGNSLTGADIQMSFVGDMAKVFNRLGPYPNLGAWLSRMQARPAFQRSIEKGGAYRFAK